MEWPELETRILVQSTLYPNRETALRYEVTPSKGLDLYTKD